MTYSCSPLASATSERGSNTHADAAGVPSSAAGHAHAGHAPPIAQNGVHGNVASPSSGSVEYMTDVLPATTVHEYPQPAARPEKAADDRMARHFIAALERSGELYRKTGRKMVVANFANILLAILAPGARRLMCDISPCGGGRCFFALVLFLFLFCVPLASFSWGRLGFARHVFLDPFLPPAPLPSLSPSL